MKKISKILLYFVVLVTTAFALQEVQPTYTLDASGAVTDIAVESNNIYVSTDASSVDIFDLTTKELIKKIKVPQIKDFMGDTIDSKIYNVDVSNNVVLLTAQAPKGYREVHLYTNDTLNTIIGTDKKMFVSKAKIVDENKIIFSLLSNEMFLYDIKNKKNIWRISVSGSKFSDFALNESKTQAVVADESGDLKVIDVESGRIINRLENQNLDNVFKVDYKNNKIITAGQDRKSVVYDLNRAGAAYHLSASFLIYGAGLSPSAKLGAYSSDEDNNVVIFDTDTKAKLYKLTKNIMTLSSILFISEDEIFITTDSNKFNYYKLK